MRKDAVMPKQEAEENVEKVESKPAAAQAEMGLEVEEKPKRRGRPRKKAVEEEPKPEEKVETKTEKKVAAKESTTEAVEAKAEEKAEVKLEEKPQGQKQGGEKYKGDNRQQQRKGRNGKHGRKGGRHHEEDVRTGPFINLWDYQTLPQIELYQKAEESGIERSKAEELIAKLKQQGDVFEPGSKFIKLA